MGGGGGAVCAILCSVALSASGPIPKTPGRMKILSLFIFCCLVLDETLFETQYSRIGEKDRAKGTRPKIR